MQQECGDSHGVQSALELQRVQLLFDLNFWTRENHFLILLHNGETVEQALALSPMK
jgi:hypothetical protein